MELRQLAEAAYRQHFYQQEHQNYFTEEPDTGPCVLSIKQEKDGSSFRLGKGEGEGGRYLEVGTCSMHTKGGVGRAGYMHALL